MIQELLFDEKTTLEEDQRQIETDRKQINEDLRQTKASFYKGATTTSSAKQAAATSDNKKSAIVPHYADEIASFEGDSSSNSHDLELPCLEACFSEGEQIAPPKPLDTTKTICAAKPKNQKKKRKPRAVILQDDDKPIKQIEIIRSQPDPPENSQKKGGKAQ